MGCGASVAEACSCVISAAGRNRKTEIVQDFGVVGIIIGGGADDISDTSAIGVAYVESTAPLAG